MPLSLIKNLIERRTRDIDAWFEAQWRGIQPLPYFSCDVRHADYKMGIVDTNLFPGGFNNLCNSFTAKTVAALKTYFQTHYPKVRNVGLIAESHTRNKFYLLNVLRLHDLIERAGLKCRVTMIAPQSLEKNEIFLEKDLKLTVYKPQLAGQQLSLGSDFACELVLSNNDFSAGVSGDWHDLNIPIIPNVNLGWHRRSKTTHFALYTELVAAFAREFALDPWLMTAKMQTVTLETENLLDELARASDDLIAEIQKKYTEYNVPETPYVFIKNDAGTYGLGLITAFSGDEVRELNRKRRNKLFASKGDREPQRFLIQEGIPTADNYSGFPIEPVLYGIGKDVVGGFFRIHDEKTIFESLNSPGMSFSCLCLHKLDEPHEKSFIDCRSKETLISGATLLARIAAIAAGREAKSLASQKLG